MPEAIDQRGGGRDVRRGHRGADVAGRQAEAARRWCAVKVIWKMSRPGGLVRAAVRVAVEGGVGAAAGGDEVEVLALVGVVGLAAVLGRGADREHVARARRVGDRRGRRVAGRADHQHALAPGVADRVEDVRDLLSG